MLKLLVNHFIIFTHHFKIQITYFIFYNNFFFYINYFLSEVHYLILKLLIKIKLYQETFAYDIFQLHHLNYSILLHIHSIINIFQVPLNFMVIIKDIMLFQYVIINN